MRSNDDVYLRIESTMSQLSRLPPANIIMGLFIDGSRMTVPRPEFYNDTKENLLIKHKALTFLKTDYPSNVFPTFPQGNAFILSRDLAYEVAAIAQRPWFRLMADDVMIALITSRFNPLKLAVKVDYEFEGTYTACNDDSFWHFNIHPEHMYDLHYNERLGYRPCEGITRFCCG